MLWPRHLLVLASSGVWWRRWLVGAAVRRPAGGSAAPWRWRRLVGWLVVYIVCFFVVADARGGWSPGCVGSGMKVLLGLRSLSATTVPW